jgi:flagellar hook protein FlgE
MNLDSRAKTLQFDPTQPDKTSNFNTAVTVYDNIGTPHLVTVYFNKTENNNWTYRAMVAGEEAEGGKEGTMVEMSQGKLVFNDKGVLQEEIVSKNSFNFSKGAAKDQKISFNFGESLKEGGDGLSASTQFGSNPSVNRFSQDGSSAATLTSLSFNDAGILTAVYNNGEARNIGQIAISKFENNEGLFKLGKNLLKESIRSGKAAVGKPGEGGRGEVLAKSIELSNVDLATEFVNLMSQQRNFQANAKTITTADQMLQEVLNLKR